MKTINFAFGVHNHQPVGNFDFVFEEAYQKAYRPFLEVLEKHPHVKIAQHFTGVLFEWILYHHPDFVERLRKLVQSGQVEMMTGGYYEPILINISDEDKFGQIEKLTHFVREHTGYNPIGIWLAERIWEPQLPRPLVQAGARYVVIDDSHFKYAGLQNEELLGYYVTEEEGYAINIFPISEKLRYTIPFQDPAVTIEYLQSLATEDGTRLIVFADDGEKFGIWPGTHKHCYQDEWLERFFSLLDENREWIKIIHFSEALQRILPSGQVYLPTASYREMMEWALPSRAIHEYEDFERQLKEVNLFDRYKVFVRGGFWRNFLAKYPESNNLHKKALRVSKRIAQIKQRPGSDSKLIQDAQNHLWAGQCNCPYWHGVFGGLYLNNLRYAVYHHIVQAEVILDRLRKTDEEYEKGWADVEVTDFDTDGREELLVETRALNLYFSPHHGGTLFELDYKPKGINLLDTMTRREEGYHRKLLNQATVHNSEPPSGEVASIHDRINAKEQNLGKYLHYDWYRRVSLIDHFLNPHTSLSNFSRCQYGEEGDFVDGSYSFRVEQKDGALVVYLWRNGRVWFQGKQSRIKLEKRVRVLSDEAELQLAYSIKNLENWPLDVWFAVEFNLALLAGDAPDRYYVSPEYPIKDRKLNSRGLVENVHILYVRDEWSGLEVKFELSQSGNIWRFPIETISQSESGFERVYQNSVILPNWKIHLDRLGEWNVKIVKKIHELKKNGA